MGKCVYSNTNLHFKSLFNHSNLENMNCILKSYSTFDRLGVLASFWFIFIITVYGFPGCLCVKDKKQRTHSLSILVYDVYILTQNIKLTVKFQLTVIQVCGTLLGEPGTILKL